ncbi:hypothetical protein chiPu_0012170 [Chiloscyllium punctatum]|uniref:Uncharacterized protein n=1 Tax=Chiloscyllium punctatum TaxID=137246 RepID=A0A401STG9_CHIPU|nr:hypothetical protein [Chiloscyllium punctatum]
MREVFWTVPLLCVRLSENEKRKRETAARIGEAQDHLFNGAPLPSGPGDPVTLIRGRDSDLLDAFAGRAFSRLVSHCACVTRPEVIAGAGKPCACAEPPFCGNQSCFCLAGYSG